MSIKARDTASFTPQRTEGESAWLELNIVCSQLERSSGSGHRNGDLAEEKPVRDALPSLTTEESPNFL